MTLLKVFLVLGASIVLAACQSSRTPANLPSGAAAYAVAPSIDQPIAGPAARTLRPGDEIAVQVYREPDLSVPKLTVDETGTIQLPLLGQVEAGGASVAELSDRIAAGYGARYLRNPKVTVALVGSIQPTVSVEGQVNSPGVFAVGRNETLLSAVSRAGSPTRIAREDEVVVFRTVNGQRLGGRFDLRDIRAGYAADPRILDGDVVVIGYSAIKGGFRDFLQVAPLLSLFTAF
ncbi:MAG: polysaccharide biosynthesis/export family protein [Novosphingobium sp.]